MTIWKRILIIALCVLAMAVLVFVCIVAQIYYDRYHKDYYWDNLARPVSENIIMIPCREGDKEFVRLKDVRNGKFTTPKLQHIFINEYNSDDSLVVFRTFDHLRGYVNVNTGEIVIPAQYNRAWNFSEGVAAVLKDGVLTFINTEGNPVFEKSFLFYYEDKYYDIAPQFHNGLCVMRTLDNKWGLIDKQGEWVVEPVYNAIYAPQNGYRIVFDGNKYGLLTLEGQMALPLEYDDINPYQTSNGFAITKDGYAKVVDNNLNTIIPFIHDGIYPLSYVNDYQDYEYSSEGNNTNTTYWRYDIGSGSGVIDTQGNVIIPAKYYMIRLVNDEIFDVEVTCGGNHILINKKGQYIGKSYF